MTPLYTVGTNALGSLSAAVQPATAVPDMPGLALTDIAGGLRLAITRPSGHGTLVLGYLITWTGPTNGSATVVSSSLTVSFEIDGLTAGQNYTIVVRAFSVFGVGASASATGDPSAGETFDPRTWDPITGTGPLSVSPAAITDSGPLFQGSGHVSGGNNSGILNINNQGRQLSAVHIESTFYENPNAVIAANDGGVGIVEPDSPVFTLRDATVDVPVHVDGGINNKNNVLGYLPAIEDALIAPSAAATTFELNKSGALMGFGGRMRRVKINGGVDQLYPIGNSTYDQLWVTGQVYPFFEGGAFNGAPPGDVATVASGNRPLPSATNITEAQAIEVQSITFGAVAGTHMTGVPGSNPSQAFFRANIGSQYGFQVIKAGTVDVSPGLSNTDQPWASWPKAPYTKLGSGDTTQPFISVSGAVTSLYPNRPGGTWNGTFSLYGPTAKATTADGATTLTVGTDIATAFAAGQIATIVGSNVQPDTTIQSITSTTATLSKPLQGAATSGTYTTVQTAVFDPGAHAVLMSLGNVYHSDGFQTASDIQQNIFWRGCRIENNSNSCFIMQNQLASPGDGIGLNRGDHPGGPLLIEKSVLANFNQFIYLQVLTGPDFDTIGYRADPGSYSRVSDPAVTPGTWQPYSQPYRSRPWGFDIRDCWAGARGSTIDNPNGVDDPPTWPGSLNEMVVAAEDSWNPVVFIDSELSWLTAMCRQYSLALPVQLTVAGDQKPDVTGTLVTASTAGVPSSGEFAAGCNLYSYTGVSGDGVTLTGVTLLNKKWVPATDTNSNSIPGSWVNQPAGSVPAYTVTSGVYAIVCDHRMLQMLCWSDLDAAINESSLTATGDGAQTPDTAGSYVTTGIDPSARTSGLFEVGGNGYFYTGITGATFTGVTLAAGTASLQISAGAAVSIPSNPMLTPASSWYIPWQDTSLPAVSQDVLENRFQLGLPPQRCGAEAWYIWKNIRLNGGPNNGQQLFPKLWKLTGLGQSFAGDAVYNVMITGSPTGGTFRIQFTFPLSTGAKSPKVNTTYLTAPIAWNATGDQIAAAVLAAAAGSSTFAADIARTFPNGTVTQAQVGFAPSAKQLPAAVAALHVKYPIYDVFSAMTVDVSGLTGGTGVTGSMTRLPFNNIPAGPGHDIQWQRPATDAMQGYIRGDV